MKRREFIATLGAMAIMPSGGNAQPAKISTLGVLALGVPDPQPVVQTALRELGTSVTARAVISGWRFDPPAGKQTLCPSSQPS